MEVAHETCSISVQFPGQFPIREYPIQTQRFPPAVSRLHDLERNITRSLLWHSKWKKKSILSMTKEEHKKRWILTWKQINSIQPHTLIFFTREQLKLASTIMIIRYNLLNWYITPFYLEYGPVSSVTYMYSYVLYCAAIRKLSHWICWLHFETEGNWPMCTYMHQYIFHNRQLPDALKWKRQIEIEYLAQPRKVNSSGPSILDFGKISNECNPTRKCFILHTVLGNSL